MPFGQKSLPARMVAAGGGSITWSWCEAASDKAGLASIQPAVVRNAIGVQADAPTLVGLAHLAAERLRHRLVAEADADQLGAAPGGAQEVQQLGDPRIAVVDARRRAGDDVGVAGLGPIRIAAGRDVVARPVVAAIPSRCSNIWV